MQSRQYKTSPRFRGYLFEREVRKKLEELNFFVFRSPGSFLVDLVAFSPKKKVYWIECKIHRKPPLSEIEKWKEIARTYGAEYHVVTRDNLKEFLNRVKEEG